ncbi:hypothetical protein AAFN60_21275 [Roseibacillus persicicus]|uniref:hypothetical protein n=1 Tax=Roseibacillus persicicus TaxID=454148 RepID=UPI00398B5CEF
MRHPTAAAIAKLNRLLGIDESSYGQDWEIEASDPTKLDEYLRHYQESLDNDDERFTLMALILGGFEEYHTQEGPDNDVWNRIRSVLEADMSIHHDVIDYYQCNDATEPDECFPITPLMRSIAL